MNGPQRASPRGADAHSRTYALTLLQRAIEESGEPVAGQNATVRGIDQTLWRKHCDTYDLSPTAAQDDSKRKAFERAVKKLQTNGKNRNQSRQSVARIVGQTSFGHCPDLSQDVSGRTDTPL